LPDQLFEHQDVLDTLNHNLPLQDKLQRIHEVVQRHSQAIERIAVAVYDPQSDLLKTFVHSSSGKVPLKHYQARLADTPSLREIIDSGRPRVVNDLGLFRDGEAEHTRRIQAQGYRSSYTAPMYVNGNLFGFIFFNSCEPDTFSAALLSHLDLFSHLISLLIINEISSIQTLVGALRTARDMSRHRDNETGAHLDRMARYSRLIARQLAERHGLSDEVIEHIFLFAPLHDIGKVAVPDQVLLKPGKLDTEERALMQQHAAKGREIIDEMLENFGLTSFQHVDMLSNIAHYHHEALDGSGYPEGLRGEQIPLEARIIAVADVFDALTSRRPYKEAWSNDEAFATLQRMAGSLLDAECVQALCDCHGEVEAIQRQFHEDPVG
jgi:HD-GYP domain-containing protein (c-di-GMP phosphodiesterase class II)